MVRVGSYTGNGSADGPWVSLPFKPAFVLIKPYDYAYQWVILDSTRDYYNVADKVLDPSRSNEEFVNVVNNTDFLSNGFKLRSGHTIVNGAHKYLYLAIAEEPFKQARGR